MKYFAYIRVSTVRQGEYGSSLSEQRAAIENFAARNGFTIVDWFEERETASKIGRHEFTRMLAALRRGKADGVIFHKIDRSARNLRDWSAIQDLADRGIDVRFTQESINLTSNEGKLTGDFMAVISAHYGRNLREEVRKGIHRRLKQGFYPLPAPIGYLDQGAAKPKTLDPMRAPLIRAAFDLYATGRYGLRELNVELAAQGLRNRSGSPLRMTTLAKLLRNPFYVGIIRVRGETYPGAHEPLISVAVFDRVTALLDGKGTQKQLRHDLLFRRMLRCATCNQRLTGEVQKGNTYYRCHTHGCPTCSVREEAVLSALDGAFAKIVLTPAEIKEARTFAEEIVESRASLHEAELQAATLQLRQLNDRINRLTDALIDGLIERSLFEQRKLSLLLEHKALDERRSQLAAGHLAAAAALAEFFELLKRLQPSQICGDPSEIRELARIVTSNFVVYGKNVAVELKSPFRELAELRSVSYGGPIRNRLRTFFRGVVTDIVSRATDSHAWPEKLLHEQDGSADGEFLTT